MDPDGKHDHQWKVIRRIDAYIRSTNTKAAVISTFNTFILGAQGTILQRISDSSNGLEAWSGMTPWWLLISAVPAAISLLFSALAVFPYLRSEIRGHEDPSLIFFQQIAERSRDSYVKEISEATEEELIKDLSQQIHAVSSGATSKFHCLRISIILLAVAGFSLLFLYPLYVT